MNMINDVKNVFIPYGKCKQMFLDNYIEDFHNILA